MDNWTAKSVRIQSEDFLIQQRRGIHVLSLQTISVRKRDMAPKHCSIHTHAKWSGRADQRNDRREGDYNDLTIRLKLEFRAEALQTTIYQVNLSQSKAIRPEVPQALCLGKQLTYDRLRIFRCEAYVAFIATEKRTKLVSHATKCIFLSYGTDGEFGYRRWDPENRKLIRSSDVVFNEDSILFERNQ